MAIFSRKNKVGMLLPSNHTTNLREWKCYVTGLKMPANHQDSMESEGTNTHTRLTLQQRCCVLVLWEWDHIWNHLGDTPLRKPKEVLTEEGRPILTSSNTVLWTVAPNWIKGLIRPTDHQHWSLCFFTMDGVWPLPSTCDRAFSYMTDPAPQTVSPHKSSLPCVAFHRYFVMATGRVSSKSVENT